MADDKSKDTERDSDPGEEPEAKPKKKHNPDAEETRKLKASAAKADKKSKRSSSKKDSSKADSSKTDSSEDKHDEHGEHSNKSIWIVFVLLAVLTVLEVAITDIGLAKTTLGVLLVSMALAKAAMVALFYMHLKSETKILKWSIAIPLFFPAFYAFVLVAEAGWRMLS